MNKQKPLFKEQPQRMEKPRTKPVLRGLIQRGLDELQASHTDWIKRNHKLKFKRQGDWTDE